MKHQPRRPPRPPAFTFPIGINECGDLTMTCPRTGKTIVVVRNDNTNEIKFQEQVNDRR